MGIVNVTPDSFYDKGRSFTFEKAVAHGLQLIAEGADLLDIGGESSRPGASPVSEEEELRRVIPVIRALRDLGCTTPISIDTYKPAVAAAALEAGASWINDITGLTDPAMRAVAASSNATVCLMHMQGAPQTMQQQPHYPVPIADYLIGWFEERVALAVDSGIPTTRLVLDPGIGFGKTVDHNVQILENLPRLKKLGIPLLLGASRKSFMSKILGAPADELLAPTLAVSVLALLAGVDILRIHDVADHRKVVDLLAALNRVPKKEVTIHH